MADHSQVATDQRDIRSRHGHIGAGANRDTEIGLGKRRGVVDAVADHRHRLAFGLQVAHFGRLLVREDLGEHMINCSLLCDRLGSRAIVAG